MSLSALFAAALALVPSPSMASVEPARHVVTLASAIELALRNNGDLAAKLAIIDQAKARQQQASAAAYPKVSGMAVLSPIYEARGNAVRSDNNIDIWGYWVQSSVTVLQPIYTWGKLSSLRTAAAHATAVAAAQSRKDIGELTYAVKELYYGAVLTEQLYSFLDDGKKEVDELVVKAEEDQKKKRPTISKRDFYRLKIFAAEANYRFEEAKKLRTLARHALSLFLGFDPNDETVPQQTILAPIDSAPPSEDNLVSRMMEHRAEFAMLKNGIVAKRALLESERTNKYPMFFVGGMLTFAHSNVRDSQQSAFAYDPYNRNTGGIGAGAQWSWDFATTLANEAMLRAEIDELEKKETYARAGLRMELKKVLADLTEARSRVTTSRDAFQVGRRWLVSETMGYSIGLAETKNLIDAYLARAKTAKDHWESIYTLNMAWASLAKTVGLEVTPGLAQD